MTTLQIYSGYHQAHQSLYNELYRMTSNVNKPNSNYDHWYFSEFLPGLKKGTHRYILATSHNQIYGCCLLKDTPLEKEITTLFVHPDRRCQGIGTELLRTALQDIGGCADIPFSGNDKEQVLPLLQKFNSHFSHLFWDGQLEVFKYTLTSKHITHQPQNIPPNERIRESNQH